MAKNPPDPRRRYEVPQRIRSSKWLCRKKRRYDTKGKARYQARKLGIWYYACRNCDGYHLTSQGPGERKAENSNPSRRSDQTG